jgi:hypothetical protein
MLIRGLPISISGLTAIAVVGCVLVASSCRQPSNERPTEPSGITGCGLSALAVSDLVSCPGSQGRCPASMPAGARTLAAVFTCRFDADESGCTPLAVPMCPTTGRQRLQLLLGKLGEPCVGEIELDVQTRPEGRASVLWQSVELQNAVGGGCRPVEGSDQAGSLEVAGACCDSILDLDMPRATSRYRVVVRTDWIP